MKRIDPKRWVVTGFDHHPSADYHALAARRLVERIDEMLSESR